jgi:glycosyltransferase involved in cell wall biosynthesis
MRAVYFVQSKYPVNPIELENLLARWNYYGLQLNQSTGTNWITIISPFGFPESEKKFPYLRIFSSSKSFLGNLWLFYREIKSQRISATLISGDFLFSLLFCFLASRLLKSRIKIQTQFHGDIYSRELNQGFKGKLRMASSRLAVSLSDNIRIVSRFQEIELRKRFSGIRAEFVTSPIPVDFSRIAQRSSISRLYDLALVGRLHYERGISEAILILKNLIAEMPEIKIVIVGQGPEEINIRTLLQSEIANGAIEIFGAATPTELKDIYGRARVLLSTAASEGYGLTLREAALSGMHVVARENQGTREAAEDFPGVFSLYESVNQAKVEIKKALKQHSQLVNTSKYISEQQEKDRRNVEDLIRAWIKD